MTRNDYLVAVDPGLARSGVAVFHRGALVRVSCVRVSSLLDSADIGARALAMAQAILAATAPAPKSPRFIGEWPQIYQRGANKTKGDPNKVTPLIAVVGAAVALLNPCEITTVYPAAWKGQVTKAAMLARIGPRLSPGELECVPKGLPHDGWDAIGIGLYGLGRLNKGRVFPGASPG